VTSLRRMLLSYILGGLAVVLVISGSTVFFVARGNLRTQFDRSLLNRATTFAGLVVEEGAPGESTFELEYDRSLDEADIGVLVRISGEEEGAFAESPGWPKFLHLTPEVATLDGEPVFRDVVLEDGAARFVAIAVRAAWDPGDVPEGSAVGRVITVEVIERTGALHRAQMGVLGAVTVGSLLAVLGATATVWIGVRRGLRPVRELGDAVDRIDTRELRLPERAGTDPAELQPIADAVESLLGRMRDAMERERRFTDAAAHELRTPIAEMKTITDVADRWPEPERVLRALEDARAVVGRMEGLLESLLAISRGATLEDQAREEVRLLPLARRLAHVTSVELERLDLAWSFEGDESAAWFAPRDALESILRNLIENAAEYTDKGGRVRVAAGLSTGSDQGAAVELDIENTPTSLTESDVERFFEPFWRADLSRTDGEHRGLGLAIVDALTRAIGLERSASIGEGGEFRVRLRECPQAERRG